jgi:hypothetical protein
MAISEAKLEANRRNAARSTGPRTEVGRQRAKLNAVKHGMRAATLVLLDEDPQVLEDRRNAWRACLLPGDDVEQRLVEDAVVSTWQQDRARRAQIARLNRNILDYGVREAQTNEEEVAELGRRLFADRLGPLTFYPTGCDYDELENERRASTSFADRDDDRDRPAPLILRLESTLLGCEWLLGQWAELRAILKRGQPWLSSDKLKAVRLLGKQPFDAIDTTDVALVFLASFVLKGDKGRWYWEILMEMNEPDTRRFRQHAAYRQLDSLKPADAAQAREALVGIIERATERLMVKAEAHRQRAELHAALASDVLAFDDSPEGERLRRYELATGRALARSLELLQKHRRAATQIDKSVKTGTFAEFDIHQQTLAITEENTTNEPTDACENVTNEATGFEENTTNEPTDACESVTNEPTAVLENVTSEPTAEYENPPSEATAVGENATNEPTLAVRGDGGQGGEMTAGMSAGDGNVVDEVFDREKTLEWIQQGLARIAAMRAKRMRELTGESRRENQAAKATRRSRRDWLQNGKTADRPTTQAARTKPSPTGINAARRVAGVSLRDSGPSLETPGSRSETPATHAGSGPKPRAGPAQVGAVG